MATILKFSTSHKINHTKQELFTMVAEMVASNLVSNHFVHYCITNIHTDLDAILETH